MTVKRGREFLQTPGPTNVPERVLRAMHRPALDPTGEAFRQLALDCMAGLKPIFRTEGHVFLYAANGHGAWEAALVNTLAPGDRVLVPETGNFSVGWKTMAESLGLVVDELPSDWRHGIDPAAVEARLAEDKAREIKAVLMVHTDTATGITSDVAAVRRAIDGAGHPALFMVDAIASLATTDFRMDEWGVDVTVAASQKGLMLPAGMSFTAAGEKALAASRGGGRMARNYWDWEARLVEAPSYRWFCGTGPHSFIYGLIEAMAMLEEEGLDRVFTRHRRLAGAVRAAVRAWGREGPLEINAMVESQQAHSITAILVPEELKPGEMRQVCLERFQVSIGGGLGRLAGKAFRIGHMGDLNEPMILGALAGVEASLRTAGIPHAPGGVTAAIESLTEAPA